MSTTIETNTNISHLWVSFGREVTSEQRARVRSALMEEFGVTDPNVVNVHHRHPSHFGDGYTGAGIWWKKGRSFRHFQLHGGDPYIKRIVEIAERAAYGTTPATRED